MFNIGPAELLVIFIVALLVVGPKRLPEVGRTVGRALREFRKVQDEVRNTVRFDLDAEPDQPQTRSEFQPIRPAEEPKEEPEGEPAGEPEGPIGAGSETGLAESDPPGLASEAE